MLVLSSLIDRESAWFTFLTLSFLTVINDVHMMEFLTVLHQSALICWNELDNVVFGSDVFTDKRHSLLMSLQDVCTFCRHLVLDGTCLQSHR
jgi:hypothetical protein